MDHRIVVAADFVFHEVCLSPPGEWTKQKGSLAFVFPQTGAGEFHQAKDPHLLYPGEVWFLDLACTGRIVAPIGRHLTLAWFSVSLEHILPLFSLAEISALRAVMEKGGCPRFYSASSLLARKCRALLGEVVAQPKLDQRVQLLRVVAAILSAEFNSAKCQRAVAPPPIGHNGQAFARLSTADMLHASVPELARRFACGRRHLNRLFREHYGLSAAGLKKEMRLLKAAALLRDTQAKIAQVAEECGFNHAGRFYVWFRERFGVSPAQWRNKPAGSAEPTDGIAGGAAARAPHQHGLLAQDSLGAAPTAPSRNLQPSEAATLKVARSSVPQPCEPGPLPYVIPNKWIVSGGPTFPEIRP